MNNPSDPRALELFQSLLGSNLKRLDALTQMNIAYLLLEKRGAPADALPEAIKNLEEAYAKDPYAFSAFRLGIGRALQGNQPEASKLWTAATTLAWGSDSLSRRVYSPLLAALRDDPGALAQFQQETESLAQEGAAGFLASVKRDTELIRRSGLFAKQSDQVNALLDLAIAKAREHNQLPPAAAEKKTAP